MSAQNIAVLKDCHAGRRIYVIASGASLDAVPASFFTGEVTVTVNEAWRQWPATYVFAHHGEVCQEAIDHGQTVVTSDFNCGITAWGRNVFQGTYYTYHHAEQPHCAGVDLTPITRGLDDTLVTCSSSVASAVHFAKHLGARVIELCGVDMGRLDGRTNYAGYNSPQDATPVQRQSQAAALAKDRQGTGETSLAHLRLTAPLLLSVVNAIRALGVVVCSLNPYIGLGLEGHGFQP